ncbi:hypothetical protein PanWU01x14_165350, partial [Parasponia andersonii]
SLRPSKGHAHVGLTWAFPQFSCCLWTWTFTAPKTLAFSANRSNGFLPLLLLLNCGDHSALAMFSTT